MIRKYKIKASVAILGIIIASCGKNNSSEISALGSCSDKVDMWQCRDFFGPEDGRSQAKKLCDLTLGAVFEEGKQCPADNAVGYCSSPWASGPNYQSVVTYYTGERNKFTSAQAQDQCSGIQKATFSAEDPRPALVAKNK